MRPAVPEPGSLLLLGVGAFGPVGDRWQGVRRKQEMAEVGRRSSGSVSRLLRLPHRLLELCEGGPVLGRQLGRQLSPPTDPYVEAADSLVLNRVLVTLNAAGGNGGGLYLETTPAVLDLSAAVIALNNPDNVFVFD